MALCYRQQPSLPLNHRRRYYLLHFPVAAAVQGSHGMSDVFWEFMWKEIIGLVVAVAPASFGDFWLPACSEPLFNPLCTKTCCPGCSPPGQQLIFHRGLKNGSNRKIYPKPHSRQYRLFDT